MKRLPLGAGPRANVVRDVFEDAHNYMKSGQLMRQVVNKINGIDFNNLAERQHFGNIYEQILNDLQSAGNAGDYYTPRAVTSFMAQMIDPEAGRDAVRPGLRYWRLSYLRHAAYARALREAARGRGPGCRPRSVRWRRSPSLTCLPLPTCSCTASRIPSFLRHNNTLARPYISWGQNERVDIVLTNPPFGGREEDGIESNFPEAFPDARDGGSVPCPDHPASQTRRQGRRGFLPDGSLFGEGVKTRLKEHLMQECNLHTIVRLPNSVFRPYASIGTNLLFFEKGEPTKDIWFWEHLVPEGQKAYSMTRPIKLEHLAECAAWWGGAGRAGREEGGRAWEGGCRGNQGLRL